MLYRAMLTQRRLRQLLRYDPNTGGWRWRVSRGRVRAGDVAGTENDDGYRIIRIDCRRYLSSRLAVLYMTGSWPAHLVDHEDLDRTNDRWENLRPATYWQNLYNQPKRRANTTGYKCVYLNRQRGKFYTRIKVAGKFHSLGYFNTAFEAHCAYRRAAHKFHGEFARTQ